MEARLLFNELMSKKSSGCPLSSGRSGVPPATVTPLNLFLPRLIFLVQTVAGTTSVRLFYLLLISCDGYCLCKPPHHASLVVSAAKPDTTISQITDDHLVGPQISFSLTQLPSFLNVISNVEAVSDTQFPLVQARDRCRRISVSQWRGL